MKIKKGEKEYTVVERKKYWSVSIILGGLTVDYEIDKSICNTEAELRDYVQTDKSF